ncbi:hypothetical protein F9B74_04395 [Pelistega sp. NLN82]|uniref:Uncharacterized protein n=1 Tax=Pelistega ratti TaxID=2652177 RepID=A0A6L9Y712_9BURK|nr:hypothetical protein [Pelistega ratti]NEN75568.1 hypothetical protein [Pelistega ratti]
MFKFLFFLVLINLLLFGLGSGWFGFTPSDTTMGVKTKPLVEFRPQDIQLNKN